MRNIKIDDLQPSGIELFSDSESYLKELSESELDIKGGAIPATVVVTMITPLTPTIIK